VGLGGWGSLSKLMLHDREGLRSRLVSMCKGLIGFGPDRLGEVGGLHGFISRRQDALQCIGLWASAGRLIASGLKVTGG